MSGEEISSFEKLVEEGPVDRGRLLDEDEILNEEDKKKPELVKNPEGKPKKPCANCTCGLADQLEKEASSAKTSTGSCNSCHLGDAFRCASCPYRGTPAFKPGEKVTIDTSSDAI